MSTALLKFYNFVILGTLPLTLYFSKQKADIKHQNSKTHILPCIVNMHLETLKSTAHPIILHNDHTTSTGIIYKYSILSRVSF